jgi:hypothetical protein
LLITCALACGPEVKTLPPIGETLVVVDTDMPVPHIVSRLRMDFYTVGDHVWYGSRDVVRAKATDWPTSFGVYTPDATRAHEVLVRLRAYPQGEVRDYRGERFLARVSADQAPFEESPAAPASGQPRLFSEDGLDATPPTEPVPTVTIDRLVRVQVQPNARAAVHIVLRGACVGTMADLANEETCLTAQDERVKVLAEHPDPDSPTPPTPTTSLVGTFASTERCAGPPRPAGRSESGAVLWDEEVCVDGASFLFGSRIGFGLGEADAATKHVVVLSPFRMDRYEVTVARWRDALARGFTSPDASPFANDGAIPREGTLSTDPRSCTFSTNPLGREDYPLTCVTALAAQAFCRSLGGDLPT